MEKKKKEQLPKSNLAHHKLAHEKKIMYTTKKKNSTQAKKINDKKNLKKSEKIANKINYDLKFIW